MRTPTHFAFAKAITLDANSPTTWVQILLTGKWKHPTYGDMNITPELLRELKENFDAGARDLVYADYDHGTRRPDGTGNAIVAGEIKAVELRNGDTELWAEYEPTEPARQKIANKEYRRTSADFETGYKDKRTGKPLGSVLCGFALTNRPYIEGMQPLALGDAHGDARLFADYTRESSMKIAEKLGLAPDASDAEVEAAIDKLNSDASQATTLSESHAAATGVIGEIRGALNLAETDDVVGTVKTLAEENAKLTTEKREREADAILDAAVKGGKITPAKKDDYRAKLLSDAPGVADTTKEIIEGLPKVIPIGDRRASGEQAPETDPEKLLDEKIKTVMKENPKLTYGRALVLAEEQLKAAAGGE